MESKNKDNLLSIREYREKLGNLNFEKEQEKEHLKKTYQEKIEELKNKNELTLDELQKKEVELETLKKENEKEYLMLKNKEKQVKELKVLLSRNQKLNTKKELLAPSSSEIGNKKNVNYTKQFVEIDYIAEKIKNNIINHHRLNNQDIQNKYSVVEKKNYNYNITLLDSLSQKNIENKNTTNIKGESFITQNKTIKKEDLEKRILKKIISNNNTNQPNESALKQEDQISHKLQVKTQAKEKTQENLLKAEINKRSQIAHKSQLQENKDFRKEVFTESNNTDVTKETQGGKIENKEMTENSYKEYTDKDVRYIKPKIVEKVNESANSIKNIKKNKNSLSINKIELNINDNLLYTKLNCMDERHIDSRHFLMNNEKCRQLNYFYHTLHDTFHLLENKVTKVFLAL